MRNKTIMGYDRESFVQYGLTAPIELEVASYPHMLITGASGSGKSQTLLFLIGKLLQSNPDVVIYLCDFKNSEDFSFMEGYAHYYAGKECYEGIMEYYQNFSNIRADRTLHGRKRYLLICDEYPAFINYLQMKDKTEKMKLANDILGAIAEILMLGRGIACGCWLLTQRADSTLFANGARDNFMVVIGLGRMSKEQKGMVFTGQEIPDEILGAGEGLLLADGKELVTVKYPLIENVSDWKEHIFQILIQSSNNETDISP